VLSAAALPDEWRRLVIERLAPFHPEKIIVFGSRARGEARPDSDVDLLVVLDGVENSRDLEVELIGALKGVPFAKDVVVATSELLARRGDALGTVYRRALREGAIIHGVDDRDARTWLRYAEEDLQAAETFSARPGFAPRIACYHAQQAAEKGFKALLAAEGREHVLTHDLRVLHDLVAPAARAATAGIDFGSLSHWHIQGRYPGDWSEATPDDARAAIAAARSVVEAARGDIGS
jgi:HEPN domain-containing protein/predicted nucleotidyltransferase